MDRGTVRSEKCGQCFLPVICFFCLAEILFLATGLHTILKRVYDHVTATRELKAVEKLNKIFQEDKKDD